MKNNKKNSFLSWLKKVVIASTIAFLLLNIFCIVYYNVPIHSISKDGSTDYVWEDKRFYMQLTEGIGYGKTNNEGYMDKDDYNKEAVDVLIMGSSHLQGLPIRQRNNAASILQEKLKKNVYNISVAGHNFKTCVSNLEAAVSKYKPQTVVIETNRLSFTEKEVKEMIDKNVPEISSNHSTVVEFLQKSPFLRLVYSQYQNFVSNKEVSQKSTKEYADTDKLAELLQNIHEIVSKYNCHVIILYHPTVSLSETGELSVNRDDNADIWYEQCGENGIVFLDMSNKYLDEYELNRILPTGFMNTAVAYGHINENGHKIIAEELYRVLVGDE